MGNWREARSFAAVILVLGIVSATTIVSCGGSDGESDGGLCEQCGDTDGPCNAAGASVGGNDRPEGCGDNDPCNVQLQCVRKVDSGQRRCFPLNPTTNSLDFRYECDGSRPALVPTSTPVPTTTLTPSPTVTPTDTGPTATGATPTSTAPTPEVTATPADGDEVFVDITIAADADEVGELPSPFSVTVAYPTAKGSFVANGAADCPDLDDGVTVQDAGSGSLAISFAGDTTDFTLTTVSCTFHQVTGQTLVTSDLGITKDPSSLVVTIDDF
jgi:hypothetical protein